MVTYTKLQQWENESGRLRGEGGKTKFIDLRFQRYQVIVFRKARRHSITCLLLR